MRRFSACFVLVGCSCGGADEQDCSALRSRDTRGNNIAYDNGGAYGGTGMVCGCVASCHLATASCSFAGSVCSHPDDIDEKGMASLFTQPDPGPYADGSF